jgi:predicted Zn-dependent protease
MLNIHDLEKRHKKYKLKSYSSYFIALISLVSILILIIFVFDYKSILNTKPLNIKESIVTKNIESKKHTDTIIEIKEITILKEPIKVPKDKKIVQKKQKLILSPSLAFLEKIKSNTVPSYQEPKKTVKPIVQKKVLQEIKPKIEKENSINIKRKDSNDDIADVIKRFKVNNSPALSLFIAKMYYKQKEYNKAYNYALITNKINNGIEDSWIIFAKSLVKLKKRDMAIKTLKDYFAHSNSSQAKILLDEILSGKFQ